MQLDLLVASTNEVVDNMGGRGIAAGAAEPLVALLVQALDDARRVVDAAIAIVRAVLA